MRARPGGFRPLALLLLFFFSLSPAQQEDASTEVPSAADGRPNISANTIEQVGEGELLLTGDVDLRYGEIRIIADTIRYSDVSQSASAEGNVVLMFGQSQISGTRLEINLETHFATVWNAHGGASPPTSTRSTWARTTPRASPCSCSVWPSTSR